jgi:hypothetical protein
MTENVRTSGAATGGWMVRRRVDEVGPRGAARASRRLGSALAGMATVLAAAALLVGASDRATAQQFNRFFSGCVLGEGGNPTTSDLIADLEASGVSNTGSIPDPEVAFVIVYSVNNDNDGQPLQVGGTRGATGPVLCLNDDLFDIQSTSQTAAIPQSGNANFLDMEQVFIVRYQLVATGEIQKVLCHTVNENVDCVRISPAP